MADEKIIFSMNGVGKILPHNNRVILKDIYLSFFYGAKIGIVGLNGSGKSTLMKIIAGIETGYQGEVVWAPGYSVGYLEQEPQMDPEKTVMEVVQEGVQEVMDILKEYEEVNMKFCEPMSDDEMNRLIERQGELYEQIDHEKSVMEVVQEGVQEVMDILKEYEEVNMKFCEPMSDDEMAALIERQGELTE